MDESKKLQPEQWLNVYGIFSNRFDFIITCQVAQLNTMLGGNRNRWSDGLALVPFEEEKQLISLNDAMNLGSENY